MPLKTKEVEDIMRLALEERLAPLVNDPLSDTVPGALQLLDLFDRLGFTPNLWQAQTLFARMCQPHLRSLLSRRPHEDRVARQVGLLRRLGERLGFYAVEGIPLDEWEQ